jgi:hypothetical protein
VTASRCLSWRVVTGTALFQEVGVLEVLANAGIIALASLFVCIFPLPMAVVYAIWPTEQRLTLVRSLSLATVFAAITGTAAGFINGLTFISSREPVTFSGPALIGVAESLVSLFFGFGCLTVTWLCVTIGLWRRA